MFVACPIRMLLEAMFPGDWREAEQLIPTLAPYTSEVGSGHTTSILRKTLRAVRAATTTPTLEDGVVWLQRV